MLTYFGKVRIRGSGLEGLGFLHLLLSCTDTNMIMGLPYGVSLYFRRHPLLPSFLRNVYYIIRSEQPQYLLTPLLTYLGRVKIREVRFRGV
jgi:hypothetical protein